MKNSMNQKLKENTVYNVSGFVGGHSLCGRDIVLLFISTAFLSCGFCGTNVTILSSTAVNLCVRS